MGRVGGRDGAEGRQGSGQCRGFCEDEVPGLGSGEGRGAHLRPADPFAADIVLLVLKNFARLYVAWCNLILAALDSVREDARLKRRMGAQLVVCRKAPLVFIPTLIEILVFLFLHG